MSRANESIGAPLERQGRQRSSSRRFIEPCHPVEADEPPRGDARVHEIKVDGYRAQLHLRNGKATVYSRRGHDWTRQFAGIATAAEALNAREAILEGEAIVHGSSGIADFHALRLELGKKN